MHTLLIVIHIVVSIFLCLVILLQSGKGGGMGASFGGASSQIFGGRGAGNFLSRVTSIAAVIFFLTSLTLSMMASRQHSVVRGARKEAPAAESTTSTPAPGAAAPAGSSAPAGEAAPAPTGSGAPAEQPAPASQPAPAPLPQK